MQRFLALSWLRLHGLPILTLSLVITIVILLIFPNLLTYNPYFHPSVKQNRHLTISKSQFENFNNETGTKTLLVPNIIHFLRFDQPEMRFVDAVCILAALKNHKPDQIFLHTNEKNFTGKYWDFLLNNTEFSNIYQIKNVILPPTIFGQNFSIGWHKPHASDVTRIRILMQYGGIFLDNDSYLVKSLNEYRYYEMVLGWDEDQYLGSQVLIANPEARFLKLWLESYRDNYRSDLWYYNAGERPTMEALWKKPELIHRVKLKFGVHMLAPELYKIYWKEWKDQQAIHLLLNHRSYLDKENYDITPEYNEENVVNCNFTFCEMAREVYFK